MSIFSRYRLHSILVLAVFFFTFGNVGCVDEDSNLELTLSSAPPLESRAPILTAEQVAIDDAVRRTMELPTLSLSEINFNLTPEIMSAPKMLVDQLDWPDNFSSPVPILVPNDHAGLQDAYWISGEHWYSASIPAHNGIGLYISGSQQTMDRPDLREELLAAGYDPVGPHFSATHGVWSVHFMAYGIAYMLDVECSAGADDARCADDVFARSVFESLVYVEEI